MDTTHGRLAGRVCLVTGAARGIGAAIAAGFVAEGATVGLLDRSADQLDARCAELGHRAEPVVCDLTDATEVERAITGWLAGHDRLDVVCAGAGVQLLDEDGPVADVPLDVWDRTFAVNARGMYLTLHHTLPAVAEAAGSVIIIGSPTAMTLSGAGFTAYAASKGATLGLAKVVAADYAARGVRVNVIIPGTTRTPLIEGMLADPDVEREFTAGVPLGRIGTPQDLVGMAVLLASDAGSYITGAVLPVDGGLTTR